jgi:hypothetical protein
MREMGTLSGVEIEPKEQTKLLNDSIALAGIIGGGVPGGASLFAGHNQPCERRRLFLFPNLDSQLAATTRSGSSCATRPR